jgi:hypothetical protein
MCIVHVMLAILFIGINAYFELNYKGAPKLDYITIMETFVVYITCIYLHIKCMNIL